MSAYSLHGRTLSLGTRNRGINTFDTQSRRQTGSTAGTNQIRHDHQMSIPLKDVFELTFTTEYAATAESDLRWE